MKSMNLKAIPRTSTIIIAATTLIVLGLFIYKIASVPKSDINISNEYYNTKTPVGLISPFQNKEEEAQYQKWYLSQRQKGIPDSTLQRKQFDHFYNLSSK